jgi:hypothetical protein
MDYKEYDPRDPIERGLLLKQIDADKAASLADIERRRSAQPVTWRAPEPEPQLEPANARQRPSNGQQYADAAVAAAERRLKARQDRVMSELAEAVGKIVAQEREHHRDELTRLRAEYDAKLQGLLTGLRMAQPEAAASDAVVLDMSKALRPRHGTA